MAGSSSVFNPQHRPWNPIFTGEKRMGARNAVVGNTPPFTQILTLRGSVTVNDPLDVAMDGDYAYVCCNGAGALSRLSIVDLSDPNTPTVVGNAVNSTTLLNPTSVKIQGTKAYVFMSVPRLTVVDVSVPTAPVIQGSVVIPFPPLSSGSGPSELVIDGNFAYVAVGPQADVIVVDVSNPLAPTLHGTASGAPAGPFGVNQSLVKMGDYVFSRGSVTGSNDRVFHPVDVTNPAAPSVAGITPLVMPFASPVGSGHNGVVHIGTRVYTADFNGDRVGIIDWTPETAPTMASSFADAALDGVLDLDGSGSRLYAACANIDGVTALDISSPDSPTVLETLSDTLLDAVRTIVMGGSLLCVLSLTNDRLTVVEITG